MGYGTADHDPDWECDTAVWHVVGVADRDKLNATGHGSQPRNYGSASPTSRPATSWNDATPSRRPGTPTMIATASSRRLE